MRITPNLMMSQWSGYLVEHTPNENWIFGNPQPHYEAFDQSAAVPIIYKDQLQIIVSAIDSGTNTVMAITVRRKDRKPSDGDIQFVINHLFAGREWIEQKLPKKVQKQLSNQHWRCIIVANPPLVSLSTVHHIKREYEAEQAASKSKTEAIVTEYKYEF